MDLPQGRDRVQKGRVALLENPNSSRAYLLRCFEDIEFLEDGIMSGSFFEYVSGDQCMLGQCDRETKVPFKARTRWGCNADRIKDVISAQCDTSHDHQQVLGANIYGPR